jgi:hypothetical protein
MPGIRRTKSVAATTTEPNLVSGSSFEYPQQPMSVSMGVVCASAGLLITVYAGSRLILEESPVYVGATTYPVIPDQMADNFIILPGERLVVQCRNTTAGPLTAGIQVEMQPVRV